MDTNFNQSVSGTCQNGTEFTMTQFKQLQSKRRLDMLEIHISGGFNPQKLIEDVTEIGNAYLARYGVAST